MDRQRNVVWHNALVTRDRRERLNGHRSAALWFTGLSGSGKTTIAHHVGPEMDRRGLVVEYLDGDTVRTHLSKGLGFSKEDRDTNIERIGWVASRLTRQGGRLSEVIGLYPELKGRTGLAESVRENRKRLDRRVGAR